MMIALQAALRLGFSSKSSLRQPVKSAAVCPPPWLSFQPQARLAVPAGKRKLMHERDRPSAHQQFEKDLRKAVFGETKAERAARLEAEARAHEALPEQRGATLGAGLAGPIERLDPLAQPQREWQPGPFAAIKSAQMTARDLRGHVEPLVPRLRPRMVRGDGSALAVGRRKTAVAQVQLVPVPVGEPAPHILVNRRALAEYFPSYRARDLVLDPLLASERLGLFRVQLSVRGGGFMAQAGACRLAIARALQRTEPALRPVLKMAGFLRRDPRMVERKKAGRKKARKRFQWSKR